MSFGISAASASLIGGGLAIGGSLLSASMAKDAAGEASDAQVAGGDRATAEQRRQYDLTRSDTAPFLKTGTDANKRLAYLLGLTDPSGTTTSSTSGKPVGIVRGNQVYNKETGAYMGRYGIDPGAETIDRLAPQLGLSGIVDESGQTVWGNPADPVTTSSTTPNDSSYGSLLKKFGIEDLNADPVYNSGLQFGLDQGTKGINARAIAGGGYDSGATLKALTQFGNDYGSTKAGDSYNRYNADQTGVYNKLAGISGTGQSAVNTVSQAGQNSANNISNIEQGVGNSRAASIVGGANAYGSALGGINSAVNSYNSNQTLQKLLSGNNNPNTAWGNSMGNFWSMGNK